MKADEREIERWMTHFEQVCRTAGVKRTHQRMEIFHEVAQARDHPDAETVYRAVRRRIPTVSLDTVYRTLWLLSEFVCRRCGLTRDFYNDAFDELRLPRSVRTIGRVETTHVEARGVCRTCTPKEQAESESKTGTKRRGS